MSATYAGFITKELFGKAPIKRVELLSIHTDSALTDKTGTKYKIRVAFQKRVERAHEQLEQLWTLLLLQEK